jgi:hypothetical protein
MLSDRQQMTATLAAHCAARPTASAEVIADEARQAARHADLAELMGQVLAPETNTFQVQALRCIFGNPFRGMRIDPAWLSWHDTTIPKIALAIYEERELPSGHLDNSRLAILADALEDAGCADANILNHCRLPGEHVRGCWVVDLLLGKE